MAQQTPAREVSDTTRFLLLTGSVVLVCAPMVFRTPDRHLRYIGRSTALYTGLAAVGLSLGSIFHDLVHWWLGTALAVTVAVVLVARDITESLAAIGELNKEKQMIKRLTGKGLACPSSESRSK